MFSLLVLTQWSDWTECRAIDSRSCSGPGIRRKTRACENGCADISNKNLTMTEDCVVTEDGFQKESFYENYRLFIKPIKTL